MPSKRSKSKERERKRQAREKMSAEKANSEKSKLKERMQNLRKSKSSKEVDDDREAAKMRMKLLRSGKSEAKEDGQDMTKEMINKDDWYDKILVRSKSKMSEKRSKQTEDEKQDEKFDTRERMQNLRSRKNEDEKDNERAALRDRMRKVRERKTNEETEYEMICQKHKKREARALRSGKEHLIQNLKAKKEMTKFREKGRVFDFQKRSRHNETEMSDFKNFERKGKTYSEFLDTAQPDIVERLNEEIRVEKERERKRKEEEKRKEKEGHWEFNGESGEYFWAGDTDPEFGETFSFSPPTEEENKITREAERKELERFFEETKKKQNEKRKQKAEENKKAMATPIDPLPERELCAYENIRENIIQEREKAMIESGFFEDLKNMKKTLD